ncbi:MAG: hypothetical protein CL843_18055 [Crocinitomicaceae bacterium]|nr:hypothetical protein [Crocinitomicaceae bacterium]
MINHNNYEIWMIDYLDGNLSSAEEAVLFAFLKSNPELKEDLTLMEGTHLIPNAKESTSIYKHKNLLKKEVRSVGNVSQANYEDLFIAYHEQLLLESEKEEIHSFLTLNPFLKRDFELYGKVYLPKETYVFADKSLLFQETTKVIPFYQKRVLYQAAAAATIALLISVGFYNSDFIKSENASVAGLMSVPSGVEQTEQAINTEDLKDESVNILVADNVLPKRAVQTQKEKALVIPAREASFELKEKQLVETAVAVPVVDEKVSLSANSSMNTEEFYTVGQLIAKQLQQEEPSRPASKKVKLNDLALMALNRIGSKKESGLDITREYNDKGDVKSWELSLANFSISKN